MPILTLLTRMRDKYQEQPHPMLAKDESLRVCYLTGLAMQAYSDGELVEEERKHFLEMARIFGVQSEDAENILTESQRPNEHTVDQIRKQLIDSKYKYYFLLDLQIMAHQDGVIKPVEADVVSRFGELLEVTVADRQFLVDLGNAVAEEDIGAKQAWQESFMGSSLSHQAAPTDFVHYTAS